MVRVFLRIWHHICVLCPCSPSSSVTPPVSHLNLQQQLPISLLLHPRCGFPSSARSFCMSWFVPSPDPHLVFFSCSSSVFGPWESHFPAPAPAVAFVFFFLTPAVLLLFVPPFVFSLKIFCHLPLQLFFTLDFPVLSLCLIPVWLNLCSLTCTCCFSVSCVLGLASGFVIHHSYSFTVWSPHFCPG